MTEISTSEQIKYSMIKMLINEAFRHAKTKTPQNEFSNMKEEYMKLKKYINNDIMENLPPSHIVGKLTTLLLFTSQLNSSTYNSDRPSQVFLEKTERQNKLISDRFFGATDISLET